LRLSSPTRRHLQAIDAGQLSLPFQAEAEPSPSSPSIERANGVTTSRPRRSFHKTLEEQTPDPQECHGPKHREKNGKRKPPARASAPLEGKILVSRREAAAMLSISIRGVDYMIADGRLATRRIANRVLIPTAEIHKFAQSDHPRRLAG
jgi:hypothetical protein